MNFLYLQKQLSTHLHIKTVTLSAAKAIHLIRFKYRSIELTQPTEKQTNELKKQDLQIPNITTFRSLV